MYCCKLSVDFSTQLCLCPPAVPYDRILSIQSLNELPNPWKGVTMNRCLVVTLAVLLMSAGINQLHCESYRQRGRIRPIKC